LVLETFVTEANGTAELDAAIEMLQNYKKKHGRVPQTVGADAGYDAGKYLLRLEKEEITPHVAMTSHEPADPFLSKSKFNKISMGIARSR
jgi:hypothetical protein